MDFYDILDQVITLLKQRGRASYRTLKVQFHLDDEALEALKDEVRADAGGRQLQAFDTYTYCISRRNFFGGKQLRVL
jgi:hypothetical protein